MTRFAACLMMVFAPAGVAAQSTVPVSPLPAQSPVAETIEDACFEFCCVVEGKLVCVDTPEQGPRNPIGPTIKTLEDRIFQLDVMKLRNQLGQKSPDGG